MNKMKENRAVDPLDNEHGAVAAMTAIFLVLLLAMLAAAIDIGHALVAKKRAAERIRCGCIGRHTSARRHL